MTLTTRLTLGVTSLLTLLLLSLSAIPVTAQTDEFACRGSGGTWSNPGSPDGTCDFGAGTPEIAGENSVLGDISNILLFLVGVAAVISIIINGFRLVASGHDPQAIANARQGIIYSIVGVVVAFAAYAAIQWVADRI